MNVEYVVLDNKEYIIIDKLNINGNKYYILSTENNKDVCLRKEMMKDNESYLVGLDNEEEFNLVFEKFLNKVNSPKKSHLPLGSIVTLHDCNFEVMIIGYSMKTKDNYVYDYCGCEHPVGLVNKDSILCFDKENIEKIRKIGYLDEEAKIFLKKIESNN